MCEGGIDVVCRRLLFARALTASSPRPALPFPPYPRHHHSLLHPRTASVIIAVACSGWRMTRCLGVLMLVGYVGFVAQDVLRNCDIVPAVAQYFQWLP